MLQILGNVAWIRITLPHARRTCAHITTSWTEPLFSLLLDLVVIFPVMLFQALCAIRTKTTTPYSILLHPHLIIGSPRFSLPTALNHISLPCLALMTPFQLPMVSPLQICRFFPLLLRITSLSHRTTALMTSRSFVSTSLFLVLFVLFQSAMMGHCPFFMLWLQQLQLCWLLLSCWT